MDLSYSFLTFLITFFLSLFIVLKQKAKSKLLNTNYNSRPPPGPPKLPIIGSMHQLRGALTHHALHDLSKKYGPIMQLKLGEIDMVVVSSPDAATEVTRTHDLHFASRPANTATDIALYGNIDIAYSPYGDYWRQLRKICVTELLSVSRVRIFRSVREEETLNLARAISTSNSPVFNLTKMLSSMTNAITCRAAFSKACENSERFVLASEELMKLSSCFIPTDLFPSLSFFLKAVSLAKYKIERAHKQIDKLLDRIIKEHIDKRATSSISAKEEEEEEEEDLVDVLLRVKDSSKLEIPITMNGIKAVLVDIFVAGTDTSKLIVEWAMSELMRNPQVMEKAQLKLRQAMSGKTVIEEADIQDHLDYLKLIIDETLRLHPPVPLLLPRLCRETCDVGEFTITKGSTILINVWSMGRDPKIWEDAESFRPERFEGSSVNFKGTCYEYIPFGAGRRMCPGIGYGLATVELTLARLLYHFNCLLPNGMKPEELDMTETFGTTVNRKNDLLLIAHPYIPIA